MKNISVACIYGFISLLSFMDSDFTSINFESISIIISWITLLCLTFTMDWFDKITDGYFMFTILLFIASRLAKYNAISIAKEATYISIGVGMGLVVNSFYNNHLMTGLLLLGIFSIEIGNMIIINDNKNIDISDFLSTEYYPITPFDN